LPRLGPGYAFYANQSFSGLLHRLAPNIDIATFALAPPSSFVSWGSGLLGAALYAGSLVFAWRWRRRRPPAALLLAWAWLVTTLVSPISWEHHYAPALFLFLLLWREARAGRLVELGRTSVALFGAAFVLLASYFEVRSLAGALPRLFVSHTFAGGLVLWLTLTRCLARNAPEPA
jgi:hypothetical protein